MAMLTCLPQTYPLGGHRGTRTVGAHAKFGNTHISLLLILESYFESWLSRVSIKKVGFGVTANLVQIGILCALGPMPIDK